MDNRVRERNARGYTTHYAYDPLDRPILTTDALQAQTLTGYDPNGNTVVSVDARSNVTYFGYDAVNRQTAMRDALQGMKRETYA